MSVTAGPSVGRLLDAGRTLTKELDRRVVLDRVLETAREITGARYAAVGILNEGHTELAQFVTSGVDERTRHAIGDLPRGKGVLGVLIGEPKPLRLNDVGRHPSSYGFPFGHPVMRSFLGVPVVIHGQVWGNLYLAEKAEGDFTEADEQTAVILAEWASIAIENARLYERSERRRLELEKAYKSLEVTRDVTVAIGGEIALEHVLELIVKRGRALVNARSLVILLREGEDLVVQASAGDAQGGREVRVPIVGSTSGQVLERRYPERIGDVASRVGLKPGEFGVSDPQTALLVPMVHRNEAVGMLAAFDRGEAGEMFSEEDELMLGTFAASAANAVAFAQSVQADRLRSSLAAAEAERGHWARALHDETLQGLAGVRVLLSSALRRADAAKYESAMREAAEQVEQEIENLRMIVTELRPAALDELGLGTAIEMLTDRHRDHSGLRIESELALPVTGVGVPHVDRDLENTAYRLVQEALTNIVRHAAASSVRVTVSESEGEMQIEVQDNGIGFDIDNSNDGYGLAGMRERVTLAGGTLNISSDEHGTLVKASLPTRGSFDQAVAGSGDSGQAASA